MSTVNMPNHGSGPIHADSSNDAKKPVVTDGVVVKRRSRLGGRLNSAFKNVGHDIILPSLKRVAYDGICRMVQSLLGLDTPQNQYGFVSYNNVSSTPGGVSAVAPTMGIDQLDPAIIQFTERENAERVLYELQQDARQYSRCKLAWLYEYVGRIPPSTANRYGWRGEDVMQARTVPTFNGKWYIGLPRAYAI